MQDYYRVFLAGTVIDVETYTEAFALMQDLELPDPCITQTDVPCYYY